MTPTPEKSCEEISAEILDMKDNTHYRDKAHLHPKFTEALLEKQKAIDALHSKSEELVKILKKIGDGDYSYGYCIRAAQEVIAKVRGGV